MNCTDCHDFIQRHLDGEPVTAPADFEAHLAGCEECQSLWHAAERLRQGLRLLPAPHAPAWLVERTTKALLDQRVRTVRWRIGVSSFASAACILFATWWVLKSPGNNQGQLEIAVNPVAKTVPVPSPMAQAWARTEVLSDASAPLTGVRLDDPPAPPAAQPRSGFAIAMQHVAATTRRGPRSLTAESAPLVAEKSP